jgi:hypothetical protein
MVHILVIVAVEKSELMIPICGIVGAVGVNDDSPRLALPIAAVYRSTNHCPFIFLNNIHRKSVGSNLIFAASCTASTANGSALPNIIGRK